MAGVHSSALDTGDRSLRDPRPPGQVPLRKPGCPPRPPEERFCSHIGRLLDVLHNIIAAAKNALRPRSWSPDAVAATLGDDDRPVGVFRPGKRRRLNASEALEMVRQMPVPTGRKR